MGCLDSQNIYNLWPASCSNSTSSKGLLSKGFEDEDYSYPYWNHIEILGIGGSIDQVMETTSWYNVPLIPNGEIVSGQAVIYTTTAGIFNYIYLPVDKTYRINMTKYPGFAGLKIFVTIPNSDGSVERFIYQNPSTGMADATHVSFMVGRGNSDTVMKRSVEGDSFSDYNVDFAETFQLKYYHLKIYKLYMQTMLLRFRGKIPSILRCHL